MYYILSHYFYTLSKIDDKKINFFKGARQGLLMTLPVLIGYLLDRIDLGLLVSTGTLAHIYAIKGTFKSKIRIVFISAIMLSICMFLGTLTVGNSLLFGFLLLFIATVVFYVFISLELPGPSSTFYIVSFALPMNLPIEPNDALLRSSLVFIGGILATIVITINLIVKKENIEFDNVNHNFALINKLMKDFNGSNFNSLSKELKDNFKETERIFITAGKQQSSKKQRLYLLHTLSQGIYAELLELKGEGVTEIPQTIISMVLHTNNKMKNEHFTPTIYEDIKEVSHTYDNLLDLIAKVNEILSIPKEQVAYEVDMRKPIYSRKLFKNLTFDSIVFLSTLRYLIIMAGAIIIAFAFKFDQAYWIPLSAHTVMIGGTTIKNLERGTLRFLGTLLGVLILSFILALHPMIPVAIVVLGIATLLGEMLVAANYGFAMIFLTIQVILLNGLASNNLSILIALPRISDVFVGVVIATVGLFIFGRNIASSNINKTIANVVRVESKLFFKLFSRDYYQFSDLEKKHISTELNIKINNMNSMYDNAIEEIFNDKKKIHHYYTSIYLLDELSFLLERSLNSKQQVNFDDAIIRQYLLFFERLAYHFEINQPIKNETNISPLHTYSNITNLLIKLQSSCMNNYYYH
ncbi:FUSC family protein [Staphylococcus nepalensis]|uniref:FUSC family protein n=1 Tax=Staphylococcus nepalensis TaxID=214473 RepID=UPI0031012C73